MRLTKMNKIKKIVRILKISDKAEKFMFSLIGEANNAVVDSYSSKIDKYINQIFAGNKSEYFKSLKELHDKQLIDLNITHDKMVVLILHEHNLNNLLYGLKQSKKLREPIKQQQDILNILTSGKLGNVVKTALSKAIEKVPEISYKYKDKGFKVPESIMPYLTGQPLSQSEKDALIKYNPEMIELEEKRRNLPKNTILAYCACLAFTDKNGVIEDCTVHSLLQNVHKEFGNVFNLQTWYNSFKNLISLKLIEIYYDERKDCPCIRISGIQESISDRYVIVPYVVFEKDFKRLETASIKIFFDIIFGLNNGEEKKNGKINIVGPSKVYFFKMAKLDTEKKKNRDKFVAKLLQYKKRYPNELRIAMFGDAARATEIKGVEFRALSKYFHFQYSSGTAVMVRIRKEYYVSKDSERIKKKLTHVRYKRKLQLLEQELSRREIDYSEKDVNDLLTVFRKTSNRIIKQIISIIAERIRLCKEYGWSKIESLGAYARKILQEHHPDQYEYLENFA